ncbi:hypothetical protein [Psychromonas sp. GE-S-Ul-11]|uniref:hypothetical protein n=1 Tax=Psychromonas sp. GE-S-Ul-11 TaxID=3241170 RepID=UPI003AABA94A
MSELNSVIPMTGYQTAKIDKPMTSVSQVMDSLTQNIRGEKNLPMSIRKQQRHLVQKK